MSTKKQIPSAGKRPASSPEQPQLYHRLDTLLHTMRCITQHEDALCELSHEVKRSGILTPVAGKELRGILSKIPSHDYVHDLDAVAASLSMPPAAKKSAAATKSGVSSLKKKGKKKSSK